MFKQFGKPANIFGGFCIVYTITEKVSEERKFAYYQTSSKIDYCINLPYEVRRIYL